jgi:hypothetical protein
MATRPPTTTNFAVAMLCTKLSHVVVAQTSNVSFDPTTGGTAATEAEILLRA